MSRGKTCMACGSGAKGANYCPNCGTSMDEETQQQVSNEYSAATEKRQLQNAAEVLRQYAETPDEQDAIDHIRERIENMETSDFPPLNSEKGSL